MHIKRFFTSNKHLSKMRQKLPLKMEITNLLDKNWEGLIFITFFNLDDNFSQNRLHANSLKSLEKLGY